MLDLEKVPLPRGVISEGSGQPQDFDYTSVNHDLKVSLVSQAPDIHCYFLFRSPTYNTCKSASGEAYHHYYHRTMSQIVPTTTTDNDDKLFMMCI